ncbi:MAG: hypothetical protein ABR905_11445 [Terracidiphilus sp.]|jgi:hypothetical protein
MEIILTWELWPDARLNSMQQATASATTPATSSFAGLLAALTMPEQRPGTQDDESLHLGSRFSAASNDDGLEDDIATLSYERALKAHARYRTAIQQPTYCADQGPVKVDDPPAAAPTVAAQRAVDRTAATEPEVMRTASTPFERNLKSASITIRLSKAECAQLHRRAADAGLTVSAYLRSCTFEAESLRAMVKDTLAELRVAKAQTKLADTESPRPMPFCPEAPRVSMIRRASEWLGRLLTPWHSSQRVARA